jgi:hypothetical protein
LRKEKSVSVMVPEATGAESKNLEDDIQWNDEGGEQDVCLLRFHTIAPY